MPLSTIRIIKVMICTRLRAQPNQIKSTFTTSHSRLCLLQHQIKINRIYLLHLNKDYVRLGALDLSRLFICEDLTEKANKLFPEIAQLRSEAIRAIQVTDPGTLEHCLNPKSCPCPGVCHPDLPDFSIYDVPRLSAKKKLELLGLGIKNARDIPVTAGLNEKQALIVERARTNTEFIDRVSLKSELQGLRYPIWFLDYETCISAIPKFNGYHPQQQIVFQYSLHKLATPDADLQHAGYIALTDDDPALSLLEHLSTDLGNSGTVMVWNKTFEMTMNKGMAQLHPEYSAFLENLNSRIYDLGEIIDRGIYLHPGFKGSWSIKNVLPVMVPELSYDGMAICKGDQASMAWWAITFGHLEEQEKQALIKCLEHYCALDTLAMVRIYQKFLAMI